MDTTNTSALQKLAQGDDQTWKTFIELLTPGVRAALGRLTDDSEAKEDALHEIYLVVISTIGKLAQAERRSENP